ncbi:MAG TPA: transglycosylase SLT domain-containing protein [Candidatus Binataceae bacterium]|nr:transglycosylase SLT domain-containing protein [Candidatus Binataceae bacterium]
MRGRLVQIAGLLLLLPIFGCAQSAIDLPADPVTITGDTVATPAGAAQLLSAGEAGTLPHPEASPAAPGSLPFVRSQPKAVPPFPLVLNRTVQDYINSYVTQPEGLRESFQRSEPFMPEMVSLLQQDGLPRDLIYLAFAESAFKDSGAGPWQLSKVTARRYGLTIDEWVDERRDPIKSTQAAAEYLAELHDQTGQDWRMTLVAWNNGDGAVNRYLHLMDASYDLLMRRLPRRTRSLMNRFMAVAMIAHHAEDYGLQSVSYPDTPHYRIVPVAGGTPLEYVAEKHRTNLSLLRSLNPALLRDQTPPGPRDYLVRIPDGQLQNTLLSTDS